jgi:2,4-dienoyl-CoA reductase-like NADH-dependent reductase (Old Yellow Enzyme family)
VSDLAPLFEPFQLKGLHLKNRIMITGRVTFLAQDGKQNDDWFAYHAARVDGGAGLIVTECTVRVFA